MIARHHFLLLLLAALLPLLFTACDDDDDEPADDDATGQLPDDDATSPNDADDDDNDAGPSTVPPVNHPAPLWPEWALRHWVWEDESTQESALALVRDYLEHDLPVGAIIIDSPWATGYNTFEFDPDKYPDPQAMIDEIHDLGARVMLWTTPNMNVDSPLYQEGYDNGYYVSDGRTYEWWKGEGSLIDYWNPDARDWWHGLLDPILDLGIDGWKCDGSEFYVYLWLGVNTFAGHKTPAEYQAAYYTDFFTYTRERLGRDRLITARPVDSYGVPMWGPSFAPRQVNFAGWVGDQDPTWFGLNAALTNMFFSGLRGYVNFGSDIGAYRDDGLRDEEVFARWVQLGALSPVMENGGAGEHRPWMYSEEFQEIYRAFVTLHHAMIPYLYSQGAQYYDDGLSVYRPLNKFNWHHLLGDYLLAAPIAEAGGDKKVLFPDGVWIDYFTGEKYTGPAAVELTFPLDRCPLYVREGAIIPMDWREGGVFDDSTATPAPLTAFIYVGESGGFNVYEEDGPGARIAYENTDGLLRLTLSATTRSYAFRLLGVAAPAAVTATPSGPLTEVADLAALAVASSGWTWLPDRGECWIKPGSAEWGLIIDVE